MQYNPNQNPYPQNPTNNLWFGNNYAYENSQPSRSMVNPMSSNPQMQQTMPSRSYSQPTQTMQQFTNNPAQTINNVIQVMGPESAEHFAVGPNSYAILMDSNRPVFYTKRSDDSGYAETKAYAFNEIPLFPDEKSQQELNNVEYVTKDELNKTLNNFKKDIEEMVINNA